MPSNVVLVMAFLSVISFAAGIAFLLMGVAAACTATPAYLVGNMVNTSLTGNIRALNGGDVSLNSPRITPAQLAYRESWRTGS